MLEIIAKVQGRKTYLVGVCMIAYGIGGLVIGKLDYNAAMELVSEGFAACTIRHAIAKK
jgi:hypothetical protein